jgi:hypothetical protein
MRKLLLTFALVVLFTPVLAFAQSEFDGTWKIDMNKIDFPKKPDVYLLQNGMYECTSCVPAYKIKADGTDQPISGHPYVDMMAVKVVSDHEIEQTNKKNGQVVGTSTSVVSSDGKTMMFTFSDSSNTNGGPPVTGKGEATRVAKGPAGSHAISGSWRTTKLESISDNGVLWTYKVSGDQLSMTTPTGQSYTAKLDGSDAPMMGDPGTTSVSVKMVGKRTLEETDKRNGKVIGVTRMTVASDGKTAKLVWEDTLHGTKTDFVAVKQ